MPKRHYKKRIPHLLAVVIALIILSSVTTVVYAALKMSSNSTKNSFTADDMPNIQINETLTEDSENEGYILKKENVTVTNNADYSVYVRAAVVATWQDKDGNVYPVAPNDTDYDITYNMSDWEQSSDGYWYYGQAVTSGGKTTPLITSCEPIKSAPTDGFTLHVNIISQSIQSAGMTDSGNVSAIQDAWNHSPQNN